jgi:hypothetical protein
MATISRVLNHDKEISGPQPPCYGNYCSDDCGGYSTVNDGDNDKIYFSLRECEKKVKGEYL